ncbi:hypothetical protein D3C85_769960 [compost metagenome]
MNPLMIAADNTRKRFGNKAIGQMFWDVPGTYQWVCPPGVTKVAMAMVSSGGTGEYNSTASSRYVGEGGNLRYINGINVTPGSVYTITVAAQGQTRFRKTTSALGYNTTMSIGGIIKGNNGMSSMSGINQGAGGNVGGIVESRSGQGIDLRTFQPVMRQNASDYRTGAAAGGGGGIDINQSIKYGVGGPGAVRIIWGDNRAFPNQNIQDM